MKTQWMARGRTLLAIAGAAALCLPAMAQYGPGPAPGPYGPGPGPGYNRQGPNMPPGAMNRQAPAPAPNYSKELGDVVKNLATAKNVQIVMDPLVRVPKQPTKPADNLTIDKAMDALAASITDGAWRRVYIKQQTLGAALPSADKLVAVVRALDSVEQTGVVVENPATGKATSYLKDFAVQDGFTQGLAAQKFNTLPVYVLFARTGVGNTSQPLLNRVNDLQQQAMQLMMQMDPDQMAQAMQSGLNMWMNVDPAMRGQMMGNMMRAGMQMFMNMPPDQRMQMMQEIREAFRGMGGIPGGPGGPGGPGRFGPGGPGGPVPPGPPGPRR